MTKRAARPRRVKARVVWMDCAYDSGIERGGVCYTKKAGKDVFTRPCIVLPRTAAAYDAMVEQMARVANGAKSGPEFGSFFLSEDRALVRDQLRAIGITRPHA